MAEDLTVNTILKLKVIKILTNLIQITNPRGNADKICNSAETRRMNQTKAVDAMHK
jgi:hypothetical protein